MLFAGLLLAQVVFFLPKKNCQIKKKATYFENFENSNVVCVFGWRVCGLRVWLACACVCLVCVFGVVCVWFVSGLCVWCLCAVCVGVRVVCVRVVCSWCVLCLSVCVARVCGWCVCGVYVVSVVWYVCVKFQIAFSYFSSNL